MEKHDIKKDEWIEIGSIMIKKRSFTMLDNYNDYLYAFFCKGDNDNNYPKLQKDNMLIIILLFGN